MNTEAVLRRDEEWSRADEAIQSERFAAPDIGHATVEGVEVGGLRPGLYQGVPVLEYHGWAGASQSRLKVMRDKSPAHLMHQMSNPSAPTEAQLLGAAIHTCVLEPDIFPHVYVTAGQCAATTSNGSRCKNTGSVCRDGEWFCGVRGHDPLPGDSMDFIALTREQFLTCLGIRDAVSRHPAAKHLLAGEVERSAVWRDKDTGVLCRGRFDDIARGIGAITDLKSTKDASPLRFRRSLYDFGYHIQGAHYVRGANALGLDVDSFGIIAVEKEAPYAVAVYQLEAAALFDGGRELDVLLRIWAECEATGEWPSYSTDVVKIDLPLYAPREINERVGEAA